MMRKATILLVLAGVFFCILTTMMPASLKEATRSRNIGTAALMTFGILGGFIALCWLLSTALDVTEEPERKRVQKWGEEQRVKAMEKEIDAYRIWAKSGKMPVKISPKGDSKE
jgi:hypothetical protein